MSSNDTSAFYTHVEEKVNPLRPYYTPGLHRQHNYTSLPSNESTTTPNIFDTLDMGDDPLSSKHNKAASHSISHALMRYVVTMLSSPFEVGTTLQQVQYAPHPDVEVFAEFTQSKQQQPRRSLESPRYLSSDDEDDDGFYTTKPRNSSLTTINSKTTYHTDLKGSYSVYDAEHRPRYQIAPIQGGLLDILSQIIKHPSEGWQSLLKGQRVGWVYDLLRTSFQSTLEHHLNDLFGLYDDTIPLMHLDSVTGNLSTMLASHIVVGLLLSPLEIMRTRMIVQSSDPRDGPYRGVYRSWRSLIQDEDGLQSIYLSSLNVLPCILYHGLTPLLHYTAPILIDRTCHISAADHPILYGAATFGLSVFALLLTMPLETIRKRLHCQIGAFCRRHDNNNKQQSSISTTVTAFQTTVPLRPVYYHGILDALYKIMKEEGSSSINSVKQNISAIHTTASSDGEDDDYFTTKQQQRSMNGCKKLTSAWGVRGLYKGFGIQLIANTMMLALHTVNGLDDDFGGLL
ncbi:mitochondrial carrier domain-containing protein [Chlamydoabsidia padenii]|nr:mitochondrial carrier domain-containing protein [Chlamydoabsidia padenii]